MKVPHSILFLSLFTLRALSATITLYRVAPTPTATYIDPSMIFERISFTISPVGVGEDGRTTYIEVNTFSTEVVATHLESTETLYAPPPLTITATLEEDASGFLWQYSTRVTVSGTAIDLWAKQSCSFQGTTAGSCVQIAHNQALEGASTFTDSGILLPVYTLTETSSIPVQTANSRALARSDVWDIYQLLGLVLSLSFMLVF